MTWLGIKGASLKGSVVHEQGEVHPCVNNCLSKTSSGFIWISTTQRNTTSFSTHLNWTDTKMKSVLWSDEFTVQLVFENHKHCCLLCQKGKGLSGLLPAVISIPSLMLWGCISTHGMGNVQVYEGTINVESYSIFFMDVPFYFSKIVIPWNWGCGCKETDKLKLANSQ